MTAKEQWENEKNQLRRKALKSLEKAKQEENPCTRVEYRGAVFASKECIDPDVFLDKIKERFQIQYEKLYGKAAKNFTSLG